MICPDKVQLSVLGNRGQGVIGMRVKRSSGSDPRQSPT